MTPDEPLAFVPVLVVGAGPTGLTLANLLGCHGVGARLVERNMTTVQEPRAVSIDDESLRTMQAAGLIDAVMQHVVAGYGSSYLTASGREFLSVVPTESIYGYPRRNAFRQPILESQLRAGLARFPHLDTMFGWRLETYTQDNEGVSYKLSGPDGATREGRAAYLIGCDGAASLVRTELGMILEGKSFGERWLIIDLEQSPAPGRDTMVFCDPKRPCIALPGPNLTRRFEFKLLPGETPEQLMEPARTAELLATHGADPGSVIIRKTVYTFHARLAPSWRRGRVLLAGDACHITPPFAGQGMNSGIRDAHNLAWKLAAVLSGQLGQGLLDSYQQERRDHVGDMINLALRMGRIMAPRNGLAGFLTQWGFRVLNIYPPARDYFAQMKYKPKPRFAEGFQIPDQQGARRTVVGRLLRQPIVRAPDGTETKLDEALGLGFVLLALTDDPARFEAATRQDIWRQLAATRLAITPQPTDYRGPIPTYQAPPEQLLGGPKSDPDLVLLVRPDRYVAAAFPLARVEEFAVKVRVLCDATRAAP